MSYKCPGWARFQCSGSPLGSTLADVGDLSYANRVTSDAPPSDAAPSDARRGALLGDDVEAVRAGARWILGTAGAVATVLLAGVQVKDIGGRLGAEPSWQPWASACMFALALALTFHIFHRAASVLVPDRISVDDLVRAEQDRDAQARGIHIRRREDHREVWSLTPELLRSVHLARAWLLPEGCANVTDVIESMKVAPKGEWAAYEEALGLILRFCRMEIARARYRQLVAAMTGVRGWLLAASLIGIALVAGLEYEKSPAIDKPLQVSVTFFPTPEGSSKSLTACGERTYLGVAIGGSISEPLVAVNDPPCIGRFMILDDVGIAVPVITTK